MRTCTQTTFFDWMFLGVIPILLFVNQISDERKYSYTHTAFSRSILLINLWQILWSSFHYVLCLDTFGFLKAQEHKCLNSELTKMHVQALLFCCMLLVVECSVSLQATISFLWITANSKNKPPTISGCLYSLNANSIILCYISS